MMDGPFYGRSYRDLPYRGRPRSHHAPSVREIPVQYVGSEEKRPSRTDSVVKIQNVCRGFLVRKSVKKIKEIRNEVEEIEKRISKEETKDLIARDSQERLKLNEMLMSLLFRLDSVRGVDSGVRDCRKAVIKKAIALQELIDAVVSSNNNNKEVQNCEKVAEAVDDQNQTAAVENQNDDRESEEVVEDYDLMPAVCDGPEESVGTSLVEACEGDELTSPNQEKNAIESREVEEKEVKGSGGQETTTGEEKTKNRELLERMIEDNERMMDLMAQLFEKNEMQTRLLSSLSQRVEQLERAFICEMLMRKKKKTKKRNAAAGAGTVDGCETSPYKDKCGKR